MFTAGTTVGDHHVLLPQVMPFPACAVGCLLVLGPSFGTAGTSGQSGALIKTVTLLVCRLVLTLQAWPDE